MSCISLYGYSVAGKPIKARFESEDLNYYHFDVVSITNNNNARKVKYKLEYYRNGISGLCETISCHSSDEKIMRPELFNEWTNFANYLNTNNKLPLELNTDYSIFDKDNGFDYKYVRHHINQNIYFYYIPGKSVVIEVEHISGRNNDHSYISYVGNADKRMFEDVVKIISSIPRDVDYPSDNYEFPKKEGFMEFLLEIKNN